MVARCASSSSSAGRCATSGCASRSPGPAGLGLVESHRGADGVYVAPHAIAAHVRRTAADTLLATFTPAAARLTHGRVVWHMSSEWADDAACPAPAAGAVAVCTDRVPDRGGFAVRVHRGYVVGCVPAGASQRKVGPRRPRRVALTFDDGPGPQTGAILRILQRAHIHATFFELGVQVRLYPALVRRTLAEGHSIGNHTWDHRPMTSLSSATADSELSRTSAVIRRASRFATCLFRPPGGAIDAAVAAAARQRQMLSVLWDVDPRDWATPGADAIVRTCSGTRTPLDHPAARRGWPERRDGRGPAADHRGPAGAQPRVRDGAGTARSGAENRMRPKPAPVRPCFDTRRRGSAS